MTTDDDFRRWRAEKVRRHLVPTRLPAWGAADRGAPNALIRSALFAAIKSGKRQLLGKQASRLTAPEPEEITAQGGTRVLVAGVQLNQYDADVFFEALHRARGTPFGTEGTECVFEGADFLRAIDRLVSAREYEDLDQSLNRLVSAVVVAEWTAHGEPMEYRGHLVDAVTRARDSKLYRLRLSADTLTLFAAASYTELEWAERMTLRRQPLAQWLHSFYCSHAEPFALTVAYLYRMTGSQRGDVREFKKDLTAAFAVLAGRLGWRASWKNNYRDAGASTVTVARRPSASQARLVERKAERRKQTAEAARRARDEPGLTPLPDVLRDVVVDAKRQHRRGRRSQ